MANNNTTFTKTLDMLNIVSLRESINDLLKSESKYAPVASLCKNYITKLNEGAHEEEICSDFTNELAKVAVHDSSRDALYLITKRIDENKRDINLANSLYAMQRGQYSYIVPMVESSLVEYMSNKNADTRTAARQSLSLFEGIKEINDILECLSFDEYEEKTNKPLHNSSLNESMLPAQEKTYTQDEVNALIAEEKEKAIAESQAAPVHKTAADIDTHINLDGTIKAILKKNTNEGLRAYCEQYLTALNTGKTDEILYESFISGLSKWNYLSAVDTEMSALKDRVAKYQQDIDLKKILKIMEGTGSYYIVPLIEGVVADYMDNKTMGNKAVLKQRLQAFEYDPFVRDILNVVMLDQSIDNTVFLGESVEQLNSLVHTEKIFSPVQYVKENECIFNVKGTYYNRKGNAITKLSKTSIANLSESFKTLCNLINHPAVKIDDLANVISIYEGNDVAKISETCITINGEEKTISEVENIAKMSHLMNEHKEGFYAAVKMINENFNKIAYIDFVKRVAMNESNGKTADVFRIKNNIFVTTTDLTLGTSTFYRNANPMQCRTYLNEHMGINVAPLFEDILPNQKAILEGIEDTKKSYESYLDELNSQKEEFEKLRDSSEDTKEIDEAIKLIEDEIADIQKKYDDFQKDSEKFTDGDAADAETESPDDVAADTAEDPEETPAEPAETEDQMQEPIDTPAEETPVDPEQAAMDSATPYDPDFDVIAGGDNSKAEVKVLRISYAENVKTGKKSNKGTAYVVIPSVDANGDITDETKTVTFYLDPDRKPVINNEYMPLMVYNSIVNAIADEPDTANIEVGGAESDITAEPALDEPAEEVPAVSGEVVATVATAEEPAEEPASAPEEPMFGLDAENGEGEEGNADIEKPLGIEGGEDLAAADNDGEDVGVDDTIPAGDYIDIDGNNDDASEGEPVEPAEPNDASTGSDPIEPATQETPAEVAAQDETPSYPIELGLNTQDIKPISKNSFTNALDDMGVEHSEVEGDSDSVTLKFANKAAVYALKDYFKEWKNFSDTEFINFFPELKKCFSNQPNVPIAPKTANESVQILGISAINESKLYQDDSKGCVELVLPMNEAYCRMFNITPKKNMTHIEIETESAEETAEVYEKLSAYSASMNGDIDEDAKNFLARYKDDFKDLTEDKVYTVNVPYSNILEQKLQTKGIQVSRVDEGLNVSVHKSDYKKAKKIFESIYGDKTPVEVKDFFLLAEESVNEGVKIRIEDTKTGKVVELNTDDDLDDSSSDTSSEQAQTSDPFKDVNTTFHAEDNMLFKSDSDSSDEGEDKKEEEKKSEESTDESAEAEEEPKEEKKEEKSKKFKFRPHKNEAVEVKADSKPLNESATEAKVINEAAEPNVYDYVILSNGAEGQIIGSLPMSNNFIVNVGGHTIEVSPKDVKLKNEKRDTLQYPVKFDKDTLKALFEQMVHCGMFVNENQITPNNTFVKYSDFINAKPDEDLMIIIDGERTLVNKKYLRVTESVNDFANVNDYVEGAETSENGADLRNILLNINDYRHAAGTATPVRVIATDATGNKSLINLPAGAIHPVEM